MKRLDLIISELERTCSDPGCADSSIKALAAARELRDMKPDYIKLLSRADEIVKAKPIYKRFIDGTPLANDISVWMVDFVLEQSE